MNSTTTAAAAAAAVAVGEGQELEPLLNLDSSKLKVPLQDTAFVSDADKPSCFLCRARFSVGQSLGWKGIGPSTRADYGLCPRHYISAYYAVDPDGLEAVEDALRQRLPPQYRDAEFNTFNASGQCGGHLASVRKSLVDWAGEIVKDWWTTAGRSNAGSVYLYANESSRYTGNGCGKTHLAYSAFKYIARRTVTGNMAGDPTETPVFRCAFIDIQSEVAEFRRRKQENGSETVWYNFDLWNGGRKSGTFDDYLANLAEAPVLFIDDIGTGRYFDRNDNPSLAATTFETIVDARAASGLPTLYTSNFGPNELGGRVGTRAASRAFRAGCNVIRMQAPDYGMEQSALKTRPRFTMVNSLTRT